MPRQKSTHKAQSIKTKSLLSGIRVLEWTVYQQGPITGVMLGDLGAEVIKIEQPRIGDPGRAVRAIRGKSLPKLAGDRNAFFETMNRNKKSITVDMAKQNGKEVIYKLVTKSDIFITNLRKNVVGKSGMGYETLCYHNPSLIYATGNGFGFEGHDADKPAFDPVAQARSGFMFSVGEPNMPPLIGPSGLADQAGGSFLAYGILAALLHRERTGEGQMVTSSLLSSMLWLQDLELSYTLLYGQEFQVPRVDRRKALNPLSNSYQCADGNWFHFCMLQSQRFWHDFCTALGIQEIEEAPKFNSPEKRAEHREELIAILDRVFASKSRGQWTDIFDNYGDFNYSSVNTVADATKDPQIIANEYITQLDHSTLGRINVVASPVSLSRTEVKPRSPAPEFGQHTEEVLIEIGGYTWEDINRLREEEII
ncbi:MAG: carnitine dehydratase [Dehalococcoidales bacterium]|jgi:crotonobetainyl-CoA:carnitine CoA-transferase CaiB-like acyl-CoA transferase|nr:carnitine dehydratase [Dehalococcoidales bacterium]|tara:strand:- start:5210 stop:6478 length:1269 start_codon:yes stop_codon:yes gene_type:complete